MSKLFRNATRLLAILSLLFLFIDSYSQCGSERWEVKTLGDGEKDSINFTPLKSTVHKQLVFAKPDYHDNNPRDKTEKRVYRIDCILVKYKFEDDSDWHLVVQDLTTNEQMVVEIPDLDCVDVSNPHFNKIEVSKNRLKAKVGPVTGNYRKPPPGTKIRVFGVGFFDKKNHPTGFKGRELHPVLELKVLE